MLLSGREDCRYAAANALADALIAPAASYPAADYARCLLPAATAESSSRIWCESVNRGSRVGGSLGRAAAPKDEGPPPTHIRPAPPGTELTQFSCDRCDKSPVLGVRWHCTRCPDFDLCDECHRESRSGGGEAGALYPSLHSASHPMICYRVGPRRVPGVLGSAQPSAVPAPTKPSSRPVSTISALVWRRRRTAVGGEASPRRRARRYDRRQPRRRSWRGGAFAVLCAPPQARRRARIRGGRRAGDRGGGGSRRRFFRRGRFTRERNPGFHPPTTRGKRKRKRKSFCCGSRCSRHRRQGAPPVGPAPPGHRTAE